MIANAVGGGGVAGMGYGRDGIPGGGRQAGNELGGDETVQINNFYGSFDSLPDHGTPGVYGVDVDGDGDMDSRDDALFDKKYKKLEHFAGHPVFTVNSDVFHKCRLGKIPYHQWLSYVGFDEVGQMIREYGLKNREKPIILKDAKSGTMIYLRHDGHHIKGANKPYNDPRHPAQHKYDA